MFDFSGIYKDFGEVDVVADVGRVVILFLVFVSVVLVLFFFVVVIVV